MISNFSVMNISKFLLIDLVIAISIVQLLFLIQGKKSSFHFLRNFNKENPLINTSIKLPDKEELIELEKIAENQGSGIEFDSLIGNWKFISVWKKNIYEEEPIFSPLLRLFSANMKLKKESLTSTRTSNEYCFISSIQFGLLTMEFSGSSWLKGKQPLLTFFLNLIELKLGSNKLLSRSIKGSKDKEKSFFALIALEENCKWLSARGQSGAVVIWVKD